MAQYGKNVTQMAQYITQMARYGKQMADMNKSLSIIGRCCTGTTRGTLARDGMSTVYQQSS